ncbi:hypothetical protein NM688_g479 [Phlebia brevispora]|uniref:Uncharacterized protein n=1 Tax=Phlebia brevispora TaxID=194682 RepID=A0ACC1TDW4_9APHY|nr:hypothetical protein NM688_g479 [Phlebia brevispora]
MAHSGQTSYACKCLNVRIHPSPPPGPSDLIANDDYLQVYVGEEGISVTLAYRVAQVISPDVENGEGPVLPNEDWAENEVLKSATGWVEVSKQCLSGEQVSETEASPLYSRTFCVVLPSGVSSAPSATPLYTVPSPSPPDSPVEAPRAILPPLPALFPPPPFTPAHPVFTHLSAAATAESDRIRAAAEEELKTIVAQKVAEIKASEDKLKEEVERLWLTFKGAYYDEKTKWQ